MCTVHIQFALVMGILTLDRRGAGGTMLRRQVSPGMGQGFTGRFPMSFMSVVPEVVLAAAEDEVSLTIAALFGVHGQQF
ncbi:PE family protein [Mycobacterium decipiens]|nr:PE family protein [Mycobacterium decipiens]